MLYVLVNIVNFQSYWAILLLFLGWTCTLSCTRTQHLARVFAVLTYKLWTVWNTRLSCLCGISINKQIQRIYVPRHYCLLFKWEKMTVNNNLRIISKPHAYLQIMTKTSVKFQKNRHKTVGGVAHTRYPVSINFDSKNARKMPKLK